jgi:hypothetical protein
MRKLLTGIAALCLSTSAQAAITTFNYTQTDSTTGSGQINGFSFDPGDGGGPIVFSPTPLTAVIVNPNPGLTPAGFVGAQSALAGASNEGNVVVGLTFSGVATANGTRNGTNYTINIPLKFAPKQTQSPDVSDYNWNVSYGDNASAPGGTDTVSAGGLRFAMWLGRDPVVDATETPNTFQRYTQLTQTFAAGQTNFTNSDTTNTTVKDATDPAGNPAGVDAAGQDLAFYYGWRDGSSLTSGAILIDDFTVGGLLIADESTLTPPVPEPSVFGILVGAALLGLRRRRA